MPAAAAPAPVPAAQADPASVPETLFRDPALRHTETGRRLPRTGIPRAGLKSDQPRSAPYRRTAHP